MKPKNLHLTLPAEVMDHLIAFAKKHHTSATELVRNAVYKVYGIDQNALIERQIQAVKAEFDDLQDAIKKEK